MFKRIVVMILIVAIFFPSMSFAEKDIINEGVNKAIALYKDEIAILSNVMIAIAAVLSVLIFIIHFLRLGGYHTHPMMRKRAISDLFVSGICTALIGGFGVIFRIYLEIFIA